MRPTDHDHREALEAHASRLERYRRGELTDEQFRPIRLAYGLYYQLHHTSHLQRIKLPGGLMTSEQLRVMADIAEDYARSVIHMTTRQDVQLHWIGLDDLMPMYERLHAVGITTRGACADTVRNVTGCFHTGLREGEPFDIAPYVMATHDYFLFHPLNLTLPRKFKIAFASCEYDCVQGDINDIALFPKVRDGQRGFAVHAGGGLGSQPFLAKPVYDFIPVEDTLVVCEAIVRVQHRHGERKNRKRARMKYVVQRMGLEKFREEIETTRRVVEEQMGPALREELVEIAADYRPAVPRHPGAPRPQSDDAAEARWLRTNVTEQKQAGYFQVQVRLPVGDITSHQSRAVARLAEEHGASEVRAANDQNLILPWIPGDRLMTVYRELVALGIGEADALHITDVVSCPGADYCSLAVSRSMGMAEAIRSHLETNFAGIEELGVFRIRISGCPNSCGQHNVGDIGLTGLSIKGQDGHDSPHYSMLVGARLGEEDTFTGRRVSGRFPLDEVPRVIAAVADLFLQEREGREAFADFVTRIGTDRVSEVARGAARVVH